jgi:hypothetical protein
MLWSLLENGHTHAVENSVPLEVCFLQGCILRKVGLLLPYLEVARLVHFLHSPVCNP